MGAGISLEEFERQIREFEEYYEVAERAYLRAVEVCRRVDPSTVDEHFARRYILVFLATWGQMWWVFRGYKNKVNPSELARAIREVASEVSLLRGLDLLEVDLENEEVARAVKRVFGKLMEVRGIGSTGASKIGHLLCPNLLVMWDVEIAHCYGVDTNPEGYLQFLKRTQELAREIVEQKARKLGCSTREAAKALSREHENRTLTKLIDEYDWWKIYKSFIF